ncbi:MAG: cupin domain-containing protein [Myxococcales bacterium]|nr:cupin domain-containing protein [Myxococcales bacterium]
MRSVAFVALAVSLGCSTPPAPPAPVAPDPTPSAEVTAVPKSVVEPAASASAMPSAPPKAPRVFAGGGAKISGAISCKTPGDTASVAKALKAAGNAPAVQLVLAVPPGADCSLPEQTGVDAAFLILDGGTSALPVGEKSTWLGGWEAMLAPGVGVRFSSRTTGATILAVVATRDAKPLASTIAAAKPWQERPGAVSKVSLLKSESLSWGADAFEARIAFGAPESPTISLELLSIEAGAAIPEHEHTEWELLSVLSGGGSMRVGGAERTLSAGEQIAIPAKTKHAFNAGTARTVVVQSYAPAGAEQRFKKLSADAATPLTK